MRESCLVYCYSGIQSLFGVVLLYTFYTDGNDLGYTETVKHKIPTIDQVPVAVSPENPPNQFQEAKDHVQKLLDNGIIQESHSPYCAS